MSAELTEPEITAACRRIERALAARINARNRADHIAEGGVLCACGAPVRDGERACGQCIHERRR